MRSFNFILKNRFFQHHYQKQVKIFVLLHDWFPMKFVFTYNTSLMWWEEKFKHLISRVNQKKIKSSRKEYVTWTCFKFWPMKNIFRKLSANESLIVACLQIYRELSNLPTFLRFHSNSKLISYLPWQNTYPNLRSTYHIKLKFFLWI